MISEALIMSFDALIAQIPFEDILVNAIGGFLGGVALIFLAVSKRGFRFLSSKVERPSLIIERKKTPENIFRGIELGAPARWVEQQLGAPTRTGENWWGYKFSDSLVSLRLDSNNSVETIAVALIDSKTTFNFPAQFFSCPHLGKLTLASLTDVEHLSVRYEESLRHSEIIITGREGPRGAWHYIAFGALSPHIPGALLPSDFDWNKATKTLISQPKDVKINWAAISTVSEINGFPWDFGLNI